jgi:hypothetical protein
MRILAILPEGEASHTILEHLGLPTRPPARALLHQVACLTTTDQFTNDSAPGLYAGWTSMSRFRPEPVFCNAAYVIAPLSLRTFASERLSLPGRLPKTPVCFTYAQAHRRATPGWNPGSLDPAVEPSSPPSAIVAGDDGYPRGAERSPPTYTADRHEIDLERDAPCDRLAHRAKQDGDIEPSCTGLVADDVRAGNSRCQPTERWRTW